MFSSMKICFDMIGEEVIVIEPGSLARERDRRTFLRAEYRGRISVTIVCGCVCARARARYSFCICNCDIGIA